MKNTGTFYFEMFCYFQPYLLTTLTIITSLPITPTTQTDHITVYLALLYNKSFWKKWNSWDYEEVMMNVMVLWCWWWWWLWWWFSICLTNKTRAKEGDVSFHNRMIHTRLFHPSYYWPGLCCFVVLKHLRGNQAAWINSNIPQLCWQGYLLHLHRSQQ